MKGGGEGDREGEGRGAEGYVVEAKSMSRGMTLIDLAMRKTSMYA